jgi:antirestriction protein ArdC
MTYKPTEEQKKRAEERRAKFRDLCKQVAALSDEERAALAQRINITNTDGHPLTAHNAILLTYQMENVTVVGGYHQWRTMGRQVKKGENGLAIWAPKMPKKQEGESKPAEPTPGQTEDEKPNFLMVTVFDISQTQEIENVDA